MTGKTDRAELNSGTLPSCHHHQPKPILSSKELKKKKKKLLNAFYSCNWAGQGSGNRAHTPPTWSNLSLPGWEPGLGGGCMWQVLRADPD